MAGCERAMTEPWNNFVGVDPAAPDGDITVTVKHYPSGAVETITEGKNWRAVHLELPYHADDFYERMQAIGNGGIKWTDR